MATVQSITKRALRLLGILQSGENPSDDEAQDAVECMNAMLHDWEHDGITLGHIDLSWTDTFPYPDNHINPVTYNFAVHYATEFGKEIPGVVLSSAESGYRNLQNYYLDIPDLEMPSTLDSYYRPNGVKW